MNSDASPPRHETGADDQSTGQADYPQDIGSRKGVKVEGLRHISEVLAELVASWRDEKTKKEGS